VRVNDICPSLGSKREKKRLGRGIGSGLGKTSGKGHKGQLARAGASVRAGFEGGQTPLYRRLPKFGFKTQKSLYYFSIRSSELNKVSDAVISLDSLKDAGLIPKYAKYARVYFSGGLPDGKTFDSTVKITKSLAQS
jgi:large subunit ribosomal protein L15